MVILQIRLFVLAFLCGAAAAVGVIGTATLFRMRTEVGLSSYDAGSLAGQMLQSLNLWLLAGLGLCLLSTFLPKAQSFGPGWLAPAILGAAVAILVVQMGVLGPFLHEMRSAVLAAHGGMENAPADVRARFGRWHGVSMLLLLLVWIQIVTVFVLDSLGRRQ